SGRVDLTVNGRPLRAEVFARTSLLDLLRDHGFAGVKAGCGTGRCGACTVLVDGRPLPSCLQLAVRTQGRSVQTVEGLGQPDALHPVQAAFLERGASPCGYCAPGLLLSAKALLDSIPDPTEVEARDALAGCLCPCAGHAQAVAAVLAAARARA